MGRGHRWDTPPHPPANTSSDLIFSYTPSVIFYKDDILPLIKLIVFAQSRIINQTEEKWLVNEFKGMILRDYAQRKSDNNR